MNSFFEVSKASEDEKKFYKHMQEKGLRLFNGSECDVLFEGPCSCGAWHYREDLIRRCNQGGNNLWETVIADCKQNGIPVPRSLFEVYSAGVKERE